MHNSDIFTSGAALLTSRCLVGVVVESLEEASADLVAALPHLNSYHRHSFPSLSTKDVAGTYGGHQGQRVLIAASSGPANFLP